jgi:hypothetical protein
MQHEGSIRRFRCSYCGREEKSRESVGPGSVEYFLTVNFCSCGRERRLDRTGACRDEIAAEEEVS